MKNNYELQKFQLPLSVTRPEVLEDGSDEQFRKVIYDLFVTATRFDEIREGFGRAIGVSGPQYFILVAVARSHAGEEPEGGVGVRALADYLGVAASHVTVEVGKLVRLGLLEKQPHPEDGRRVRISLTTAGRAALEDLAPLRQDMNDILFDGMSADEFRQLARVVARFTETTARAQMELARREQERRFRSAAE